MSNFVCTCISLIFLQFSMISFVVINTHEYLNLIVCVLNHSVKDLASILVQLSHSELL